MGNKEYFRARFRVMLKRLDDCLKLESQYGSIFYSDIQRYYHQIQGYIECAYDMGIIDDKEESELKDLGDCLRKEWMEDYRSACI